MLPDTHSGPHGSGAAGTQCESSSVLVVSDSSHRTFLSPSLGADRPSVLKKGKKNPWAQRSSIFSCPRSELL